MADAVDFKKTQKDLYMPGAKPCIIDVPEMAFIMLDGEGDPNTAASFQAAVEALYGLSYAIKMSKNGAARPEGYFDFVVPPLEGLWLAGGMGAADKSGFRWTLMIRQPDFVTAEVYETARGVLAKKKPGLNGSAARFERFAEGLCAQAMHTGPYDDEPATVGALERFIAASGCRADFSDTRRHHEIYLGDPRKTVPEKLRTVIRIPIAR